MEERQKLKNVKQERCSKLNAELIGTHNREERGAAKNVLANKTTKKEILETLFDAIWDKTEK